MERLGRSVLNLAAMMGRRENGRDVAPALSPRVAAPMQEQIHERIKHEFFRNPVPEADGVDVLGEGTEITPRGLRLQSLRLRMHGQSHTLGGMLSHWLNRSATVTEAAYTKRHPQDYHIDVSVTSRGDARAELRQALLQCEHSLHDLLAQARAQKRV